MLRRREVEMKQSDSGAPGSRANSSASQRKATSTASKAPVNRPDDEVNSDGRMAAMPRDQAISS